MSGNGTYRNAYGQERASAPEMTDKEFRAVLRAANIVNNKKFNNTQAAEVNKFLALHQVNSMYDMPSSAF
jgi:hypothetical protein